MSGATLIFWVIVALCALESAVFLALARFDPVNRAAPWFSAAFAAAAISFAGEIVLTTGLAPGLTRMVIALAMVGMFILLAYGLARRYRVDMPPGSGLAITAASALLYYLILDLPRADFTRQMLYQLPYALLSLLALSVVARARAKQWFDWLFLALFALLAIHFLAKPFLAAWTDGVGADPADFAGTLYAGLSSASGAVLLLVLASFGLVLMLRDTAGRLVRHAERDPETGLLNRTGFTAHAERRVLALADIEAPEAGEHPELALTLIAMDPPAPSRPANLPVGEFAALLVDFAPRNALVGRMADLEFAILAPGHNLFAARRAAEDIRKAAGEHFAHLTLAVGITEREPGDVYSDLLARGLWALNEAERAGGNCLRLAARSEFGVSAIRRG